MARQAKSQAKPLREGSAPTAHEGNTGTRSRARLHQQEGNVTANATDSRALGNKRQLGQTVPSNHISKKSKLDDPADKTTGDSGETDDEIEAETMRQTMEAQEVRKKADEEALRKKRGENQTLLKKLEEQAILKKKEEEQALLKKAEEEALEKEKKEEEALGRKEQEDAIGKQAEEEPDRQQAEGAEGAETGSQVTANSEMEVGNGLQGKSQAQTRKRAAGKKKAGKQTARNMTNEEHPHWGR
ncbi:hypothetical protein CDV31_016035 [Fusarium ambrosium]|uniref:Uncharacterized protein n=1 Tax=Fusarium ambrosium TaxID=131363 RepID=A0A428SFN9_9HYPO|nr:hypothetical protein CDV31_016035 [Fusarium ambrosium]